MNEKLLFSLIFSLFSIFASPIFAQKPTLRSADKWRIFEAKRISDTFGDSLFPGFSRPPFTLLLLTDSAEFLFFHPNPSQEFQFFGEDADLKTKIWYRPNQFFKGFKATFPAVEGLQSIVIGTPELTNSSDESWIITVLHERFHQFTFSENGYYDAVDGLDLSGGDSTGMWMLNYPLPYSDPAFSKNYAELCQFLKKTIASSDKKGFKKRVRHYLKKREAFARQLSPADYRYFSFQVWQEGLAAFTELLFLNEVAETNFQVNPELRKHVPAISFSKYRENLRTSRLAALTNNSISEIGREAIYNFGFAEGILLEKMNPSWRKRYNAERFFVDKFFEK